MAGSLRFPLKKCVCHGEKIPCGRRIFVRFYLTLVVSFVGAIALAGSITPKVWTDREGQPRPALDMVAHQVLTTYHVTRKRRTVQAPHHGNERPALDDGEPLDF